MSDRPVSTPPGALQRLWRNPVALSCLGALAFVILMAVLGPVVFHTDGHSPTGLQFASPSGLHLFGTDVNGRDVFARVLEGARISLLVGFSGAAVSLVIGTAYGLVSGYAGGRVDATMMRLVEVLY